MAKIYAHFSPIHDAAENGDMSILRMLLSFGADPTLPNYHGESAYDLAEDMSDIKAFLKVKSIEHYRLLNWL